MSIKSGAVYHEINTTAGALDGINTEVQIASSAFDAGMFSSQYFKRARVVAHMGGIGTKSSANGNLVIKVYYGTTTLATVTLSPTTSLSGKSMSVVADIYWTRDTTPTATGQCICHTRCDSDVATLSQSLVATSATNLDGSLSGAFKVGGAFATADAANVGSWESLSVELLR